MISHKSFEEFKSDVKSLADNPAYYIGIDIGGTNTRIVCALELSTYEIETFKSSRVSDLIAGIKRVDVILYSYLQNSPQFCCIDIAGPTTNVKKYKLTNYEHDDCELDNTLLPPRLCPPQNTQFLNDLESGCYGLVSFIQSRLTGNLCTQLTRTKVVEGTIQAPTEVTVVLAAGTGLGVGLINRRRDSYFVIPCEFGHIQISPTGPNHLQHQEETKLLNAIIPAHDTNRLYALEYEDIVSGRGLIACYNYYANNTNPKTGEEIASEASQSNDPSNPCVKAMLAHYRYLLRASQELAVGLKATSVYLIGDNIVRNKEFLEKHRDELLYEYYAHPKRNWIDNTPVYVQNQFANLNLFGTIYYARNN